MQKQTVLFSLTFIILSGLVVYGYFFIDGQLNDQKNVIINTSESYTNPAPTSQKKNPPLADVQGLQSAPTSATTAPALPGPSEFSAYEQYASAANTQFIDVVNGAGDSAVAGDTVAVVYSGYLTSWQLFDQSKLNDKNEIEPFVFKLGANSVIQGWEEGIVGMKPGGQRRLIIPSQLAYGAQGTGEGAIPPNAMLIFDVQLAQVQKN